MQTSEEMTMSERDRITELEHRIGQATEEAESMAMEGGAVRECALRFLGALEVPVAEWPAGGVVADADGSVTDDTSRVPPAAPEQSGGRVERDTATARTLITGALLAELGRRLYEYENTITWNTTCLSCSAVLDSSVRETFRREQAEEKLTAIRDYCCERTDDYADAGTRQTVAGIRAIIGSGEEGRG